MPGHDAVPSLEVATAARTSPQNLAQKQTITS